MTDISERVKKLRELLPKITPGPWYGRITDDSMHMCCDFVSTQPPPAGMEGKHEGGDVTSEPEDTIVCTTLLQQSPAGQQFICNVHNAQFIAEARNSLEEILDLLNQLEQDRQFLSCLQAAGVDSWDGYEHAQEMFGGSDE